MADAVPLEIASIARFVPLELPFSPMRAFSFRIELDRQAGIYMKCDRCFSTSKPAAPMLQKATWLKIAKDHENLCSKCAFARARKRRITLTFDDLLPCASNLAAGWFNMFLDDRPILAERSRNAAAWRYAMLVRNAEIRRAAAPGREAFANAGKLIATGRNGLALQEAPEGGLYLSEEIDWANGEKYLKVSQPGGEPVEILIRFEGDGRARLKEIIAPHGPGSLGTLKMRSIYRLLEQAYPTIKTISGYRVTGARGQKPKELSFSLQRLAGTGIESTKRRDQGIQR
jgi:hypothetical protein